MLSRDDTPSSGKPGEFPDEKWSKGLPTIVEYMTQDKWGDGKERELSGVTVKYQDGLILIVLNDVAQRRSLYVSANSVEGALKALEKAVSGPGADWRAWSGKGRKK